MIRLRTLGTLDLRDSDGQELRAALSQPKRAALLAYLALATPRGYHRRDTLIALFWPEYDAEHARNALSQAVHFLRRSLGAEAVVNQNGDALGLQSGQVWCDVVAFEAALDAGRSAEAVDLYRGELLEGFHVSAAPEFERWLGAERARLADRYVRAVEALAVEREAVGDSAGAVTSIARAWRYD
jgi:DNA-binding SARP family transcriptional activator